MQGWVLQNNTVVSPLLSSPLLSCCCTTTWVYSQYRHFKTKQHQASSITGTVSGDHHEHNETPQPVSQPASQQTISTFLLSSTLWPNPVLTLTHHRYWEVRPSWSCEVLSGDWSGVNCWSRLYLVCTPHTTDWHCTIRPLYITHTILQAT